eukprot:5264096-Amphidinium_carterae.1
MKTMNPKQAEGCTCPRKVHVPSVLDHCRARLSHEKRAEPHFHISAASCVPPCHKTMRDTNDL